MEKTVESTPKLAADIPTNLKELARIFLVGSAVGLLVALFSEVIARFFIEPVFCRSADAFAVCANGGTIAFNVALVIISMITVAVLVKLQAYRPLLVALGPAASLWGLNAYIGRLSWLEYGLWMVILFGIAYILFFWLMRARNFAVALIGLIIAVVALRVVLAV